MSIILNKFAYILAGVLLLVLFWTAFWSMTQDSLTFDELAHIPAGYSYLTQKDYRVNPEHPPLIKDLASLPLLFLGLNFPSEDPVWTQKDSAPAWWVQFDLGTKFLYGSGNNPRDIIFWSRLPMILLLVFLGWFLFQWARKLGGNYVGLAALTLFSFSPNFIAHGRLVTTDVGAAFGATLATYFWLKFLYHPKRLNVFLAGLFLGIALLIKFSLILLIPFFFLISCLYIFFFFDASKRLKAAISYFAKMILTGIIALSFVIWPVYYYHTFNYPAEHQMRDTAADLAPNQLGPVKNLVIWTADKSFLRPLSQYLRGLLMASQRVTFGNTVYFLGEISASGWWYYFPVIYFLKVPLPLHILTMITLGGAILLRKKWQIKKYFPLLAFLMFLAIYWITAIAGNLNIGVRHLLPTFPFFYLLIAAGIGNILNNVSASQKRLLSLGAILLFGWYIISSLSSFPRYLSYFNEVAGGNKNGYQYAVDSNYDWGQDFYRLLAFVEKNNIKKIYLDYFGGENPRYWLGKIYTKLEPRQIKEPPLGWVAVSVNQLQGGMAKPKSGFDQQIYYYRWLDKYTPVAKAGYSIFIYHIQ